MEEEENEVVDKRKDDGRGWLAISFGVLLRRVGRICERGAWCRDFI